MQGVYRDDKTCLIFKNVHLVTWKLIINSGLIMDNK